MRIIATIPSEVAQHDRQSCKVWPVARSEGPAPDQEVQDLHGGVDVGEGGQHARARLPDQRLRRQVPPDVIKISLSKGTELLST